MNTDGLLGHRTVREGLDRAIRADRLPHALLLSGPEGVGKRTLALALARDLVAGEDPEQLARLHRNAHDRFLLYEDLDRAVAVRRSDILELCRDEDELLEVYAFLESEGWMQGASGARGPAVIDLLSRDPERFTGRKGIPFSDVLERELARLARAKRAPRAAVAVARRLFSPGTCRAPYRRTIGIELVNGRGEGAYFRTVDSLLRSASDGSWRVCILDDAHRMTRQAENAFLKTLEEPPASTLLVLITSEPMALLPTTVSRCARVVLDAVPRAELERFLAETQGVPADEAPILAALAEGSVRRALELRAVDLAERRELLRGILTAASEGDLRAALALVGASFAAASRNRDAERREARVLLELLALAFRDAVVSASAPGRDPVSGVDASALAALAAARRAEDWQALFARTERALADVQANVEPRLAVEALLAEALPEPAA